jgi:hypothetical protein
MNKPVFQPLTVLMQSESSGFGWALTPGRPSLTVIALKILIALCAVLPLCVIGLASFTAHISGTKQSIPAHVAPNSTATPAPAANADDRTAVSDADTHRTDAVATIDNSQSVDQAPTSATLPIPVSTTPPRPEATVNDSTSTENAPRVAGRIKLEKFRRRFERKRARLEELYQMHAISAEDYKQGEEKYRGEIARYRRELNSAIKGKTNDSKF